jgi:cation:H+ antiporter
LKVRSSVVRRKAPLAFGAVVVFAVLLLRGLDPVAGVISTILLCGALVLVIRTSRSERADPVSAETEDYLGDPARHGLIWEAARTLLGVVGTLAGARLLVVNAASIAVWLGARQEASAAHRAGLRKPPVPAAHGPGRRCGYPHRGRARNSPAG